MRRLSLILSAIALAITMSFGQSRKVDLVTEINFESLSSYLQLKPSQIEEVSKINEFFISQLKEASYASESRFNKKIHVAVFGNLKLLKDVLSKDQYRKYLILINVANNNNRLFSKDSDSTYLAETND